MGHKKDHEMRKRDLFKKAFKSTVMMTPPGLVLKAVKDIGGEVESLKKPAPDLDPSESDYIARNRERNRGASEE
jgi:hypothetical protein